MTVFLRIWSKKQMWNKFVSHPTVKSFYLYISNSWSATAPTAVNTRWVFFFNLFLSASSIGFISKHTPAPATIPAAIPAKKLHLDILSPHKIIFRFYYLHFLFKKSWQIMQLTNIMYCGKIAVSSGLGVIPYRRCFGNFIFPISPRPVLKNSWFGEIPKPTVKSGWEKITV